MLNDQQKAVVKATAPILATNGEALLAHFYSRLLTHNPELKQLFNMTHQRTGSQPRALAHAVHAYATSTSSEFLLPTQRSLKNSSNSLKNPQKSLALRALFLYN